MNDQTPETSAETPAPGRRWYALKVFYNKVFALRDELAERHGMESYIPLTTVMVERRGNRRKETRPLISSLMFVRANPQAASELQGIVEGRAMVYTRRTDSGREPEPIPDREMELFMLVTSGDSGEIEYLGEDSPRYHCGDRVRVTDGPFKGSEGHIVRIRDNRRLVVTIEGLCAVATGYIPRPFLCRIDD